MMKLLLHTCCAPCSVYCIEALRGEQIEPTVFWYNPNIHPYHEYRVRRNCLVNYAKEVDIECIIEDAYGLDEFVCNVNSHKNNIVNRCKDYCYPMRLRHACNYARKNGFDTITTTLLYSIYQKHDYIAELLEGLAVEYGLRFYYRDFREGWREGQQKAREAGLYMQKYCGCVYSEEEAYVGREIAKELKRQGQTPTDVNIRKVIEKAKLNNGFLDTAKLKEAIAKVNW